MRRAAPGGAAQRVSQVRSFLAHLFTDSLYRNSLYLILNTFVMGGLGFFFWIACARLFTPVTVGLGSALISVISLVTTFSMLGLNAGLIHFLPKSRRKDDTINTVFLVVILMSTVVASIFLLTVGWHTPALLFIQQSVPAALFFIAAMIILTLHLCVESVFMAYRSSGYVLLKGTLFSFIKLGLPFLLVGFGAFGIFGSWTLAAALSLLVVLVLLMRETGYRIRPLIDRDILSSMFGFSARLYIIGFVNLLPTFVLPLLVTNVLGPEMTAYYYVAMMAANLLFVIPTSISNSLFAEGSHAGAEMGALMRRSFKFTFLLLIPAAIIALFFGNYVLLLFGTQYASQGFVFLQLLSLSSLCMGVSAVFATLLRVEGRLTLLFWMTTLSSATVLVLAFVFVHDGLAALGLAWLAGQAVMAVAYLFVFRRGILSRFRVA